MHAENATGHLDRREAREQPRKFQDLRFGWGDNGFGGPWLKERAAGRDDPRPGGARCIN